MTRALSPKALRTRSKLLEVTAEIISKEGYPAWNEEYLCERCECSRGALRYQFPQGKYDLFPALIEFALDQDAGIQKALGKLSTRERLYLVLSSLRKRPPSQTTVAMLEIWMASRGDARLRDSLKSNAQEKVLSVSSKERDPELVILYNLLVGLSLSSIHKDFDPKVLTAALDWLLPKLPVPADLSKKAEALAKRRAEQRFPSAD